MGFGSAQLNAYIDATFKNTAFTPPTSIKVGLSTTKPAPDGSNITEPSGGGYARVTTAPTAWERHSDGKARNSSVVSFGTASGSWGVIAWSFIMDQADNFLGYAPVSPSRTIGDGIDVSFAVGALIYEIVDEDAA